MLREESLKHLSQRGIQENTILAARAFYHSKPLTISNRRIVQKINKPNGPSQTAYMM